MISKDIKILLEERLEALRLYKAIAWRIMQEVEQLKEEVENESKRKHA